MHDKLVPVLRLIQYLYSCLPNSCQAFHATSYPAGEISDERAGLVCQKHIHLHISVARDDYILDQSEVHDIYSNL